MKNFLFKTPLLILGLFMAIQARGQDMFLSYDGVSYKYENNDTLTTRIWRQANQNYVTHTSHRSGGELTRTVLSLHGENSHATITHVLNPAADRIDTMRIDVTYPGERPSIYMWYRDRENPDSIVNIMCDPSTSYTLQPTDKPWTIIEHLAHLQNTATGAVSNVYAKLSLVMGISREAANSIGLLERF